MGFLIDISSNNGRVDFVPVKRAGIEGAIIKATEGKTYVNPYWKPQREDAGKIGFRVGAYHYARPDSNPFGAKAEAEHFCSVVGKLNRTDIKPVLDLEVYSNTISHEQLTAWSRDFNRVVKDTLGVWPMFYSYSSFITSMQASKPIGNGLWLAHYSRNDGYEHGYSVPAPWKKVVAHQFTSRGRVAGVSGEVDLSSFARLRPLLAKPIAGWL